MANKTRATFQKRQKELARQPFEMPFLIRVDYVLHY